MPSQLIAPDRLHIVAVLQGTASLAIVFPLIRDTLLAGPAMAGAAGLIGWAVARCFSSAHAANDNHPRLAPRAPGG